ncbi:heat shock protein 90-6, mitochondrial [Salvia divinorum]|uniref:Heat shock protein 90-6, mitochondrial n=1 Tax=Salvia divinorum TaxID=28513 RepID=A0ABD1HX34_SALDI
MYVSDEGKNNVYIKQKKISLLVPRFFLPCSNASDALNKLRFLAVTQPELLKDSVDLDIRIQTDEDNGIITLADSGIGMTRQEIVVCLSTIAQSGTAKFLKALKDSKDSGADSNLIGQFGVGFYSAFLVPERVEVSTKSPKSDKQYVWESEANSSSYTIREDSDPAKHISRGARLTLYLKHDDKGFAHPKRVEKLVKNYSQFVSFPIYTWQEKEYTKEVEVDEEPAEANKDEQTEITENKKKTKTVVERYWDWELINETQPIWLRNPKEVAKEDYNEFYKKTFNDYLEPLASSHFTTEGEVEFRSILYVPSMTPSGKDDMINPKTKNIRLFVKRFPRYFSFIKCVVDSNELPLNVSREILQESRIVRIKKKRLVRKAFDMILGISMSEDREDYMTFWRNFGKHMKLGGIEFVLGFLMYKVKEMKQEFGGTCDWIKKRLGQRVASVQVSNRLRTSPCVLAAGKFGWSANMERLMKAQNVVDTSSFDFMKGRRVLEINPEHPIIKSLNEACKTSPSDEETLRAIDLLYETALFSSGFTPESPAELGGKIYEMMNMALLGKWGSSAAAHSEQQVDAASVHETVEAEVVEPAEATSKK